jgi:hypothetical protein
MNQRNSKFTLLHFQTVGILIRRGRWSHCLMDVYSLQSKQGQLSCLSPQVKNIECCRRTYSGLCRAGRFGDIVLHPDFKRITGFILAMLKALGRNWRSGRSC